MPSAPTPREPCLATTLDRRSLLAGGGLAAALSGCSTATLAPNTQGAGLSLTMPVLRGWFDGEEVLYLTTDISRADVALDKGANFAPRLAAALSGGAAVPGRASSADKVYVVTNFEQGSVFASAPLPVGPGSRDTAYTPLWQMVMVSWRAGPSPRPLKSQEEVLDAAEKGWVQLQPTPVVLNCPIVQRGGQGGLPGMQVQRSRA